jgi:hypothetical protein
MGASGCLAARDHENRTAVIGLPRHRGQPGHGDDHGQPHKGSHTAVVIGAAEEPLGELRVRASAT